MTAGPEVVPTLNRYLRVSNDVAIRLETASSRLTMARNRRFAGNKAIDGSVCLEALFTDSDERSTEITFRLALRAALLLGSDHADRQRIRNVVKDFYNLRSRIVHGGAGAPKPKDQHTVEEGLKICAAAIQKFVDLDHVPDWDDLELRGPDP
jgi:hypothetical protein